MSKNKLELPDVFAWLSRSKPVFQELEKPSERAAIILCVAMVEDDIETLLRAAFKQASSVNREEIEKLISPTQPLSSSVARSRLLGLLGFIEQGTLEAIAEMAKVRNRFAHWKTAPKLDDAILAKVSKCLPKHLRQLSKKLIQACPLSGLSAEFFGICMAISWELNSKLAQLNPIGEE